MLFGAIPYYDSIVVSTAVADPPAPPSPVKLPRRDSQDCVPPLTWRFFHPPMVDPTALVSSGQLDHRAPHCSQSLGFSSINTSSRMLAGPVPWMHRLIAGMDGVLDVECTFSSRNVRGARGGATVDDILRRKGPRTTYICTWMNVLDWTGLDSAWVC